jgi:hypothetical protein
VQQLFDYFILVVTALNVVDNLEPRPFTTVMIATAIPAAIKPYSIAVAPEVSARKRRIGKIMVWSFVAAPLIAPKMYESLTDCP